LSGKGDVTFNSREASGNSPQLVFTPAGQTFGGQTLSLVRSLITQSNTSDTTSNNSTSDLAVYPNPVNDILHVSVPKLETNAIIHLYSFSSPGKQVRTFKFTQAQQDLSLQGLAPGYYFMVIKNGSQTINRTIIKK
jgi:aminopeptidase YwaD